MTPPRPILTLARWLFDSLSAWLLEDAGEETPAPDAAEERLGRAEPERGAPPGLRLMPAR